MVASCSDACQYGGWCLRIGLGMLGVFLFHMLLLTIAGIVVLGYQNPRPNLVASYARLGASYEAKESTPFGNMRFSVLQGTAGSAPLPMAQALTTVTVNNNDEDVPLFTSRTFLANSLSRSLLSQTKLTVSTSANTSSTTVEPRIFSAPTTLRRSVALKCGRNDCGGEKYCECSLEVMANVCTERYNGTYASNRKKCEDGDSQSCGLCSYTGYLTAVCVPMAFDPVSLTAVPSVKYTSCEFPFTETSADYSSAQATSTVSVRIMAENDPYIELQRLTQGTLDFGWSVSLQRVIGGALLAAGLIGFTTGAIAMGCSLKCYEQEIRLRKLQEEEANMQQLSNMPGGIVSYPTAIQVGQPVAPQQAPVNYAAQQDGQQQQPTGYSPASHAAASSAPVSYNYPVAGQGGGALPPGAVAPTYDPAMYGAQNFDSAAAAQQQRPAKVV